MYPVILLVVAFVPMIAEAVRSRRNARALRACGAVEPYQDVYAAMQMVYPACFAGMVMEAWLRRRAFNGVALAGWAVFIAAKGLKYWAIATLAARWTFRVLVPPGSQRIDSGPYQFMRHPNYIAVIGELTGMALMARAPVAGVAAILSFAPLVLARIWVEEGALGGNGVNKENRGIRTQRKQR